MKGDNGLEAILRAGGVSSSIQSPRWLKFCPICVEEDKKQFDYSYLHRLHQVPGVEVCPVHKVFLENSDAQARGRKIRYQLFSVERSTQSVSPRSLNPFNPSHRKLEKLPKAANALTELVETREEFAFRRIQWAVECFRNEGASPAEWQLIDRTGLDWKVQRLPKVREEIVKSLEKLSTFK